MPFQPGNKLGQGRKDKPFRDALMIVLKEAEDKRSLRLVAESVVDEAIKGNMAAAKEIADRLDGKVPQGIIGGEDGENPVGLIVNVLRFTDADAGNKSAEQLEAPPVPVKPVEIP